MTVQKLGQYLAKLEQTSLRNEITQILADFFRHVPAEEIDKAVYLTLGKLAPPFAAIEFNLAEKMMVRVIASAFKVPPQAVVDSFKQKGDLGETALWFRQKSRKIKSKKMSIAELYRRLRQIAQEGGEGSQERKIQLMAQLLRQTDPQFLKYLVRIPLGKLRLGFSAITILDALSWMATQDKSLRPQIEAAYCVVADIGYIAQLFKKRGIAGLKNIKAKVGVPILAARAERLPTAEKIIEKLGRCAVEPKIDGFRVQIHLDAPHKKVQIFSRNLENTTSMFPDIVTACQRLWQKQKSLRNCILDGEAIGFDPRTHKLFSFQETVQRKRKYGIAQLSKQIPLVVFVFDILLYNSQTLLHQPFAARRKILERVLANKSPTLKVTEQKIIADPQKLRQEFHRAIKAGYEGLMCKKLDSVYQAGARNFNWVKYKKLMESKLVDTIDCLVMGYYKGRGKRASFGIGAFLVGVYEKSKDRFLTVAKIGTGLSDEQWRQMRQRCDQIKTPQKPKNYQVDKNLIPDVWCQPAIVVEIKADEITKSPIHTAGFALRFPRLERFRSKRPEQATSVTELLELAGVHP